jgi:cysteine desulfurase
MKTDQDRPVYMDHNATTPVLDEVVEAMLPFFSREFGNPSSSTHAYGRLASEAVDDARQAIADLIGAESPETIVFTAGATESDNLAIAGACASRGAGGHLVTCAIEHEAVLESCQAQSSRFDTTVLPVREDGVVDPDSVRGAITDRTVLVSIMMANNEIGTIQPLEEVGAICRDRGVLFHSDAVQAAGRIPIDVQRLGLDMAALTAHKMYGPKGIGALYVRRGVELAPLLHGGGQEGGLRSGTLNVPAIVGFGAAARAVMRDLTSESARQAVLRDRLWRGLQGRIGGVRLNGSIEQRIPNNLNVAFEGVESEALLTAMRDVAALSAGSACASAHGKGSYVIRALRPGETGETDARSSIRFGLGRCNDEQQVDHVIESLEHAVARLRSLAPAAGSSI